MCAQVGRATQPTPLRYHGDAEVGGLQQFPRSNEALGEQPPQGCRAEFATTRAPASYAARTALILEGTLFLTQRWHYSELAASLGIAPNPISCLLLSPVSGRIVAHIGVRASAALGGATISVGVVWWLVTAGFGTSYAVMFLPGAILAGASTALLQPPLFGASALLPADQLSLGSGTLMMARQTSSALGVAILTAILAHAVVPGLGEYRAGWAYMAVVGVLAMVAGRAYRPGRACATD